MKNKLLKLLDGLLGGALVVCLSAAPKIAIGGSSSGIRRLLVIRPGGIGDAVLLAPALCALKDRFPQSEVVVLAERRNAAAFTLCPAVDRVLLYDVPADLVTAIRGAWDVVIDSEQWHRLSAVVARLAAAPVSIGFATNERERLFVHQIAYSHDNYEVQSFLSLLGPLGIEPSAAPLPPFLLVPELAKIRAEELLAPLAGKVFVVFFPGASIAERRWGGARFREVAELLAGNGFTVVVVGGKEDREEGETIVRDLRGVNLAGMTTLAETAAVIARSRLLLSGDSGVLHIAVGLGIPTVSLFGPGIEAKWGPKGEGDVIVNRRLPCSPCTRFGTTPPCPTGAACLSEITPGEVADAVEAVLRRQTPGGLPRNMQGERKRDADERQRHWMLI